MTLIHRMNVETIKLSHIWAPDIDFHTFHAHTAFIVSHKHESLETLLDVLWHLPENSPILVVTNCAAQDVEEIKRGLVEHLPDHIRLYLIHQKDEGFAEFFDKRGVHEILGEDGKVRNGKGEAMYIGTLCALLLGHPERVIFFDADNDVPSPLLEYVRAIDHLFLASERPALHNVRIWWASKPDWKQDGDLSKVVPGRCSSVISPVFTTLFDELGLSDTNIMVSNAGEQALSIETARRLRFSSGYSVETFQLLDFVRQAQALEPDPQMPGALLQQYQARGKHFHQKGDEAHIRQMIAESVGCFYLFDGLLTVKVRHHIEQIVETLKLPVPLPRVYRALEDLQVQPDELLMERYRLHQGKANRTKEPEEGDETRAS